MSSATHLTALFSFGNISTSRLMFNPLRGVFCVSNTSFVAVKAIQTSEGIKMKQPKTFGLEWLYLSLASFNGSGYADKSSPESYIESYVAFKRMKKIQNAVDIVRSNYDSAVFMAESLCRAKDAGHIPSKKNYDKFMEFYASGGGLL